ncbi:MAG: hypothetical protein K6D55_07575 [Prevotella sp.]|nr:hypothetical protein [Prevotella sp.]
MQKGVFIMSLLLALLTTGCSRTVQSDGEELNAVYFWRTELRLDSLERNFLERYAIKKVYCRYFDVVMDGEDDEPHPNATITFSDTLPKGVELVPTVYITENCMHQRHDSLARRVVRRVAQMNQTNGISGVKELQIDCDYTDRSRLNFYHFLEQVRQELITSHSPLTTHHSSLITLSATIRLHQLQMPAPPVDYGVLMLYNTGDPRRFEDRRSADGRLLEEGKNPVLDLRDVRPYARYLAGYALPLSAAYPVYRWVRHVGGVRIEHTVDASEILGVKQLVEQKRPSLRQAIITYHLDEENINRYSHETFEAIYQH